MGIILNLRLWLILIPVIGGVYVVVSVTLVLSADLFWTSETCSTNMDPFCWGKSDCMHVD